ncbi:hypothetical protein BGZ89_012388 [Linnemannia elongata]|nr:hypothetical protein BGZ89_012388 [Linnemannia elongata]
MVWHVQRPNLVTIVEQHEGKENFVKRIHILPIDYIPEFHSSSLAASTESCRIFAQIILKAVKYNHVIDCYNTTPFHNALDASTIATVITIF